MAEQKQTAIGQSLRYIVNGLLVTVFLLAIKLSFEQTQAYAWFRQTVCEWLTSTLPSFREKGQSVIVVDISHLPGGTPDANNKELVTSRAALRKLLTVLAELQPRAVAIDIDFSPNPQGWRTAQDPAFFDFCLSLSARMPVVLGVYRSQAEPAQAWLGAPAYAPLAASMLLDPDNLLYVPVWLQAPGVGQRLPSLAAALAWARYGPRTSWLDNYAPWVFRLNERHIDSTDPAGLQIAEVLVNYSGVRQMISETIRITSAEQLYRHGAQIKNRLVLLGAVDQATDKFAVPGLKIPRAGVFVHAGAAFTLASEPVYALGHSSAVALDLLVSLFVLLVVVRARRGQLTTQPRKREAAQTRALAWAVVGVMAGGFAVVYFARIFWYDFVFVMLFLLLHSAAEKRWHHLRGAFKTGDRT